MKRFRGYVLLGGTIIAVLAKTPAAPLQDSPPTLVIEEVVEARALEHERRVPTLNASSIAKQFGTAAIPEWEKYLDHEDGRTRANARFGIAQIGKRSDDVQLRRNLLTQLVKSSLEDSQLDGKIAHLFGFRPGDATDEVRRLLLERLNAPGESGAKLRYEPAVIQATGRLVIREAIPRLKELRALEPVDGNEKNPFRGRWAMLALARMGDSKAIQDTIATLENIEDGQQRTMNLGYLSIIHQPEAVEHLKKYLFSDTVYPTEAADLPAIRDQDYAYWALISMLVVPKDVTYTNFREWIGAQKSYTYQE